MVDLKVERLGSSLFFAALNNKKQLGEAKVESESGTVTDSLTLRVLPGTASQKS